MEILSTGEKIKRAYFKKSSELIEVIFLDDNILSKDLNIEGFANDLILLNTKLQENKRKSSSKKDGSENWSICYCCILI